MSHCVIVPQSIRQEDKARDSSEGGDGVPRRAAGLRGLAHQRREDAHLRQARVQGHGDLAQ